MNSRQSLTLEPLKLEGKNNHERVDSSHLDEFDDLVRLASMVCHTPYAYLTIFEKERKWFKSKAGISFPESPIEAIFCVHSKHTNELMIIRNARKDQRFDSVAMVHQDPHICFYTAIPLITSDGYRLGNLCVLDVVERSLTKDEIFGLHVIAKQLMQQIEQKLYVLDLTKSIRKIHKQNKELKRLNMVSTKLVSIISHDLRSPMTTLKGFIEVSDLNVLSEAETSLFKNGITTLLDSTLDLMENLIQWGSMHMKESKVEHRLIRLDQIIEEVVSHLQLFTYQKNNKVINHLKKPYQMLGDDVMLRFVIRNLIQNANKFTHDGQIEIQVTQNDDYHIIKIIDNGRGIKAENLDNLFNWSKRVSSRGTSGEKGAGLGLLICEEFVEKHKGSIKVESTYQKGSVFTIYISKNL